MYEWERQIQTIVDEIDECIKNRDGEALALASLARRLGYSEFHASRKFREVAGMPLRDYLRRRKLAFALKERSTTASRPTRRSPGPSRRPTALRRARFARTRARSSSAPSSARSTATFSG